MNLEHRKKILFYPFFMKTLFQKTKRFFTESTKVALGVLIGVSLVVAGSVYAALDIPADTKAGDIISSASWNKILAALRVVDQRTDPITNSSGNIGIGKSPTTKLDVAGDIKTNGNKVVSVEDGKIVESYPCMGASGGKIDCSTPPADQPRILRIINAWATSSDLNGKINEWNTRIVSSALAQTDKAPGRSYNYLTDTPGTNTQTANYTAGGNTVTAYTDSWVAHCFAGSDGALTPNDMSYDDQVNWCAYHICRHYEGVAVSVSQGTNCGSGNNTCVQGHWSYACIY